MKPQYCKLLPEDCDFDFWIKNNLNVLLISGPGCGKTTMIVEAFMRHKLKFKYYSAATMDPWVDFIGVPHEQTDEKGKFLDLIRPKEFRDDEIEALCFDEFNRSPKKVRNAVMELLQFKSINGRKFNNLRMIWSAINPFDEEETFDVEKLDPAQIDRFQIHVEIPSQPNSKYFTNKFGKDKAMIAIEWWNKLPDEVKRLVTPRRLEDTLKIHALGGNISHVLPENATVAILKKNLNFGSPKTKFLALVKAGKKVELTEYLKDSKVYDYLKNDVLRHLDKTLDCLSLERQTAILAEGSDVKTKTWEVIKSNPEKYKPLLEELSKSTNPAFKVVATAVLKSTQSLKTSWTSEASDSLDSLLPTKFATQLEEIYARTIVRPSTLKLAKKSINIHAKTRRAIVKDNYNFEAAMIGNLNSNYNTYSWTNLAKRIDEKVQLFGICNPESLCTIFNCLLSKLQADSVAEFKGTIHEITSAWLEDQGIKTGHCSTFLSRFPNFARVFFHAE